MKKMLKTLAVLGAVALTSACTTQTISRAEPLSAPLVGAQDAAEQIFITPDYNVTAVNVIVPNTLSVSEANSIKPRADIVWRDDPIGSRHEQVQKVVYDALMSGVAQLDGTQDVIVDVQITRFHAQTQRVRYSFGGEHEIEFYMTIRDANSGSVIAEPRLMDATFDALGGMAAVQADQQGITQKVRITEYLAQFIQTELKRPVAL